MRSHSLRSLVPLVASILTTSFAAAQTTWYVDASATPPGNGTLASPYAELQFALAQATTVSGDTLLVAPGTYFGGFDFLGKDVVVQSTSGAAVTILDGGAIWPPPPIHLPQGPQATVVSFVNGESAAAVLDGFTIQHGRGTPQPGGDRGGGVRVVGASPSLRNLVVRENRAVFGAGMLFESSSSLVRDCTIQGNTVTGNIGLSHSGIGIQTSSAIAVERCTISDNVGYPISGGGGISASAGTFTDCVVSGNQGFSGGGAHASGSASFLRCRFLANSAHSGEGTGGRGAGAFGGTFVECEFAGNVGAWQGGGAAFASLTRCIVRDNVVIASSGTSFDYGGGGTLNCTLVDCVVRDNEALASGFSVAFHGSTGGGVYGGIATGCEISGNRVQSTGGPNQGGRGGGGAANATLVDCDVFDNVAETYAAGWPGISGGGLFGGSAARCRFWGNVAPHGAGAANASLTNCTLVANTASASGGALASVYFSSATANARNCILWANVPDEAVQLTGTLTIEWSDVEGGFAGPGNINLDPLFQSAANHDFHLLAGSPCIDAGDPTQMDPNGSRIDMGAYPFECEAHTYCVGKVNSLGCTPTAGFTGFPDFSGADDFHVTGVNIRKNALGMLLWARSADALPFHNGTLCVGQPFVRAGIQSSGGTGTGPNCTGQFDFHFSHAYMANRGIAPFETLFAQWYMRDATHPDGTSVGLSDAVSFTVCP